MINHSSVILRRLVIDMESHSVMRKRFRDGDRSKQKSPKFVVGDEIESLRVRVIDSDLTTHPDCNHGNF